MSRKLVVSNKSPYAMVPMYLASAFLPKPGPFFVRSNVGGDPDLRQMSFPKRICTLPK